MIQLQKIGPPSEKSWRGLQSWKLYTDELADFVD